MNTYLLLKCLHIVSSVFLVGTGFGSAFYMFFVNRSDSVEAQATVARLVVRADWWFTTPTILVQLGTGMALAHQAGFPLTTPWLALALGLFLFSGACWLPVVLLQIRMAEMARVAALGKTSLPQRYWTYAKWWEFLGYPAFAAMLVIFYLMVVKPSIWA